MKIKDAVVVVTGASGGIGRTVAQWCADHGAKVVLAARSKGTLAAMAKEFPDAIAIPTDMRNPKDITRLIKKTIDHYGRIDVLVNNAGQGMHGPVETININDYERIMNLNVYGVLRAMQAVIPIMREQGSGTIINVSSLVSKNYFPGLGAYASTKYALNALSLTARQELAPDNITVSVMHPKMTATHFVENSLGSKFDMSARGNRPAPQVDTPEQVAEKIGSLIESGDAEAEM